MVALARVFLARSLPWTGLRNQPRFFMRWVEMKNSRPAIRPDGCARGGQIGLAAVADVQTPDDLCRASQDLAERLAGFGLLRGERQGEQNQAGER